MDSEDVYVLDSQQSNTEHDIVSDFHSFENPNASLCHNLQNQVPHPNPFVSSNQFNASQLQFHPHIGLNRVTAPYPSTPHQLYGSGLSFQGLLHGPIPFDTQTSNTSKGSKRKEKASNSSKNSQPPVRRNWTIEEDIALTKAYLYVTTDSIAGKDQTHQTMWNRVMNAWTDKMGKIDDNRGTNSLQCRWTTIQAAVNKFHGYYESLERAPRSGTTVSDMKKEAMTMYKELGDGSSFKFEHCWEILKANAKWCSQQLTKTVCSKKAKTTYDSSIGIPPPSTPTTPGFSSSHENDIIDVDSTATEHNNVDAGVVRPPGRKGSKEKKKRMNEQKGVIDVLNGFQSSLEKQYIISQKNLELREQMLKRELELKEKAQQLKEEAHQRKEKTEKRKEQEHILNIDLTSLQPVLRNAYVKMQAKIMKEWENEGLLGDVFGNDDVEM